MSKGAAAPPHELETSLDEAARSGPRAGLGFPAGHTWQLGFSEEFEGSGYDAAKLTPCFDWNYGGCTGSFNQGREYYAASQIHVSGGAAHLVAEPTSPPIMVDNSWQRSWNKGLLDSTLTRQLDVDYIRVFQQH